MSTDSSRPVTAGGLCPTGSGHGRGGAQPRCPQLQTPRPSASQHPQTPPATPQLTRDPDQSLTITAEAPEGACTPPRRPLPAPRSPRLLQGHLWLGTARAEAEGADRQPPRFWASLQLLARAPAPPTALRTERTVCTCPGPHAGGTDPQPRQPRAQSVPQPAPEPASPPSSRHHPSWLCARRPQPQPPWAQLTHGEAQRPEWSRWGPEPWVHPRHLLPPWPPGYACMKGPMGQLRK